MKVHLLRRVGMIVVGIRVGRLWLYLGADGALHSWRETCRGSVHRIWLIPWPRRRAKSEGKEVT